MARVYWVGEGSLGTELHRCMHHCTCGGPSTIGTLYNNLPTKDIALCPKNYYAYRLASFPGPPSFSMLHTHVFLRITLKSWGMRLAYRFRGSAVECEWSYGVYVHWYDWSAHLSGSIVFPLKHGNPVSSMRLTRDTTCSWKGRTAR